MHNTACISVGSASSNQRQVLKTISKVRIYNPALAATTYLKTHANHSNVVQLCIVEWKVDCSLKRLFFFVECLWLQRVTSRQIACYWYLQLVFIDRAYSTCHLKYLSLWMDTQSKDFSRTVVIIITLWFLLFYCHYSRTSLT